MPTTGSLRSRLDLAACALLAACASTSEPAAEDILIARTLGFARSEAGVSEGFDLDGDVTATGDDAGCGIADDQAPDGTPGVDNSFGAFLPLIELAGGGALESLVQAAVDSGELLLALERGDPDTGGGCVPFTVSRAAGAPQIGGDGLIVAGQTFDRNTDAPSATACVEDRGDGVLVGALSDLRLPLFVFDETIDLTLLEGRMRLTPHEDGTWTGVIGGSLAVENIQSNVASFDGIGDDIPALIDTVLDTRADMSSTDDACDRISAAMVFQAVDAFFFAPDAG